MNVKNVISSLGQYYERVVAVVVMLVLMGFAGWLVFRVSKIDDDTKREDQLRPKGDEVKPPDLAPYKATIDLLSNGPSWTTNCESRLFVAPLMKLFEPQDRFPKKAAAKDIGDRLSAEGFRFKWLRLYKLSLNEKVGDNDDDQDGFSNREEYEAQTNPIDPNNRPDIARKLRIEKVSEKPFPFVFKGVLKGAETKYGIAQREGKKEFFVKMHDLIPDRKNPGFRIIAYTPKIEEFPSKVIKGTMEKVDVSELTLQKEGFPPVVVIRGRGGMTGEFTAKLYFLLESKSIDVQKDSVFSLQNIQYQVISIKILDDKRSEVIIQRIDNSEKFSLLPLNQTDLLKNPSSPTTEPPTTETPKAEFP